MYKLHDDDDDWFDRYLKELKETAEEEMKDIPQLSEASCTLQDYMNAWILWNSDKNLTEDTALYTEYLLQVVSKRAEFVSTNIQ